MAWNVVFGYRMRYNTATNRGDILINHSDPTGNVQTTTLQNLPPDQFGAIGALLRGDKDHRILFDGTTLDAGPERT
jgi:hypothetical protein